MNKMSDRNTLRQRLLATIGRTGLGLAGAGALLMAAAPHPAKALNLYDGTNYGNNLEINLPSGKKPPADHKPKPPTRIDVSAAGQITLNDEAVTLPQLKEQLRQLKTDNPDLGVVVKGADDVDYQIMVNVMDTLRQLDITKMGLATE